MWFINHHSALSSLNRFAIRLDTQKLNFIMWLQEYIIKSIWTYHQQFKLSKGLRRLILNMLVMQLVDSRAWFTTGPVQGLTFWGLQNYEIVLKIEAIKMIKLAKSIHLTSWNELENDNFPLHTPLHTSMYGSTVEPLLWAISLCPLI